MKPRRKDINISEAVANDLGVAIVTGRLSRDATLPIETQLCQQYGASRTALREAMKLLTAKGLISIRPRQGTRIRPEADWNLLDPQVLRWLLERNFSYNLLIEFTEIRAAVEPGAAALAARHASPEDRAAISAAIASMFAAEKGLADPLEADIAFHAAVLNASANRFYMQLGDMIEAALRFSIRRTRGFKGLMTTAMDHKRIADAVLAGDPLAASDAMRAHIQEALHLIRRAEMDEEAAERATAS
jgi:DNA-binding FadR family transcriptional regulator